MTKAEREIVEACVLKPRYSGALSHTFWREVKHPANDGTLYVLACALQDLEARVLREVNAGLILRAEKFVQAQRISKRLRRGKTAHG